MKIEDIIFHLRNLDKVTLVNSPESIAIEEAIRILSAEYIVENCK